MKNSTADTFKVGDFIKVKNTKAEILSILFPLAVIQFNAFGSSGSLKNQINLKDYTKEDIINEEYFDYVVEEEELTLD